ncbi:MAG TPA: hypothetical protein PLY87_25030 [Planctomycetaceae bacterium]|nr:hypothetical protein [Planctomycetaceae bacterium]
MSRQPFRTTPHELLDQLEPASGSSYVCPGASAAISRSIHLARLNAAWPGCDQCTWRFDSEGLATSTIEETERIRSHRIDGIRRTEFGIRGQYINDLDRQTASDLTRIFCICLHDQAIRDTVHVEPEPAPRVTQSRKNVPNDDQILATLAPIAPVIVGYDGRSSSVDLAVGVVAASREFGMPVIDVGRGTAASIQEAARCFRDICGAILVTGSGSPNAWAGLDVFDCGGEAVPVVWKDFGVQLEHVSSDTAPFLKLRLPETAVRSRWARRLTRQSGSHDIRSFEDRYRDWLRHWYPLRSGIRILIRTDDVLLQQRLGWLSQSIGMEIICRSTSDATVTPSIAFSMTISEDDRQFQVFNVSNNPVSFDRLALALNRAVHSQPSHVTAHADAASNRFWLTDAARPGAGKSTESIQDALATLGLIVRLMESKRLGDLA